MSGYEKISSSGSQRSGGSVGAMMGRLLFGFFIGFVLGALGIFGAGFAGFVDFSGSDEPIFATEIVTEVVQITATQDEAVALVATEAATNTPDLPTNTPTELPTLTSTATIELPTETPSVTPDFSISGEVQGEVNVRYGPGSDYPIVGVAQAGERFQITGTHTQFDWIQIRYDSSPTGFAWIFEPLLFNIQGNIASVQPIAQTAFNFPTLTPTPSVIQSRSGLNGETVQLSPAFANLGNRLFDLALTLGFDPQRSKFASLYLLDLQTGEAIAYNTDIAYRGTSINKISILVGLYEKLNTPPNQSLAVDLANTMICSENASTNRVLSTIGGGDEWAGAQEVTNMLETIGLENTFLLAPYTINPTSPPIPPAPISVPETNVDQERASPEPYNQLTVEDMGRLLASIYQCGYEESGALIENFPEGTFEPRECRQMIHLMASNTVDGLLKAGVPATTRVAHKHGWVDDTHTNAAIIFTPGGNFVMVMAFHSTQVNPTTGDRFLEFPDSLPGFAESSRMVYNYFNPDTQLAGIREGFIPDAPSCNLAGDSLIGDLMQPIWDR